MYISYVMDVVTIEQKSILKIVSQVLKFWL